MNFCLTFIHKINILPHDTFAKNYLKELLSPLGEVTIGREIIDEPNKIDVLSHIQQVA
jgi:hypothetical protein